MIDIGNLRLFRIKRVYDELVLADDETGARENLSQVMEDCNYEDQEVTEIRSLKDLRMDFTKDTIPWGQKEDMSVEDFFLARAQAAWERRRPVHVITDADVDEDEGIFACLGRVQAQDVGKVIYRVDGVFQVENDAQCQERRQTLSDVQVKKTLLMDKLLVKQAEVNLLLQEIAGS